MQAGDLVLGKERGHKLLARRLGRPGGLCEEHLVVCWRGLELLKRRGELLAQRPSVICIHAWKHYPRPAVEVEAAPPLARAGVHHHDWVVAHR